MFLFLYIFFSPMKMMKMQRCLISFIFHSRRRVSFRIQFFFLNDSITLIKIHRFIILFVEIIRNSCTNESYNHIARFFELEFVSFHTIRG